VAIALGLGHLGGVSAFEHWHFDLRGAMLGAAGTLPMLGLLLWCLRTTWGPMRRLVTLVEERLGPHLADASAGGILVLALLAGVGEELLFRGVIQTWLAARAPLWLAVATASVLFGVGHWLSASYAVLAGFIGAYLGLLFLMSGNLLAPMIAHAAYDVVALFVLTRRAGASRG
jgi:membrane protease YdiL (CAAX protease family)